MTMTNEEQKYHEDDMIQHFRGGVVDGCVCGLCEAVREICSNKVEAWKKAICSLVQELSEK